jgi:protein-tyrosine phosphatase
MDKVKRIASFFRQYRHWDCIPDPYYGGSEGFENVLDLLDDACQNIADQIETKQI